MKLPGSVLSFLAVVEIAAAGSSLLHAQQLQRRTQGILNRRAISLGERSVHELAVDAAGNVVLSADDALIRIDPFGDVQIDALADLGYGDMHNARARAVSSDAQVVAGGGLTDDNFYTEATWWDADAPGTPHSLGGVSSMLLGVESTPSGLVMVGFDDNLPIDVRPEGGGVLPGVAGLVTGQADGLSANGSVYCGMLGHPFLGTSAVRWIERVPELLDDPVGQRSHAFGVSSDGQNFAGSASNGSVDTPVVWLAAEGLVLRRLRHPNGSTLSGQANGILDNGFTFGESSVSPRFAWVWHPGFGTDRVMRFDDWLAAWGLSPVGCPSVKDVAATRRSYHFSIAGDAFHDAWYVQTPKGL